MNEWTDRRTAMAIPVYPPQQSGGGYKKGCNCQHCLEVLIEFPSSIMTESGKYATKNTGNKPLH